MKKMHHSKRVEREPWAHVPRFMWRRPNVSILNVKTQKSLLDAHVQSSFEPNNMRYVIELKENLGLTFIFGTDGQTSHADQNSTPCQNTLFIMRSTCLNNLYMKCSFSLWSFHHSCHEMLVRLGFVHEHSKMRRSSGIIQIIVSNVCGTGEKEGGGGTEANFVLVVLLGRRCWRPNKWEAAMLVQPRRSHTILQNEDHLSASSCIIYHVPRTRE